MPRLLHRLRTTLGSTNIRDFQQLLDRHVALWLHVGCQEVCRCRPLIYTAVHDCSLSALLMLRDALQEAAKQRSSLLDASARAEQLWGAASESGVEAACHAHTDQTGV